MQLQQRAIATSLLLDAPDVWLAQLLSGQYLDSDSQLSLFQTCKKFNEMVMQNNNSTSLRIDPLARPRNRVLNMLQTANKHAPTVKLILHDGSANNTRRLGEHGWATQNQMMRIVCSILKMAAKQKATAAITELQMEDAWLETVFPPAVGQACPNLTKLSLHDCTIRFYREMSTNQHFRYLRALVLCGCNCDRRGDDDDDDVVDDGSQENSLPGKDKKGVAAVSSLTIVPRHSTVGDIYIINSLAASLNHLHFHTTWVARDYAELWQERMNWVQLGVTLQHLHLPGLAAGDKAMEIFLNMPCLTHLLVLSIELMGSFAGRPCKWEELVVECLDPAQLAYLPLHAGIVLKLGRGDTACRLHMNAYTSHLLPQAISNVKQAMALEWVTGQVSLTGYEMEASKVAQWLAQALPLLKDIRYLDITSGRLNGVAMQTLCEFARGREDGLFIRFSHNTCWVLGNMVDLVKHMPRNGSISLNVVCLNEGRTHEQQITQLCCAAQRQLSLHAHYGYWAHPCEQSIRSATQACGVEVLSLVYGRCSLDVTVQPRYERFS